MLGISLLLCLWTSHFDPLAESHESRVRLVEHSATVVQVTNLRIKDGLVGSDLRYRAKNLLDEDISRIDFNVVAIDSRGKVIRSFPLSHVETIRPTESS